MTELGEPIGAGKVAEVFAYGDLALKLYRAGESKAAAFREAAILARVEALGLPAPRVEGVIEHGGRWGVLMTRVTGAPLAELMLASPSRSMEVLEALAALHARIHACSGAGLPRLRDRLVGNIAVAPGLDGSLRDRLLARARDAEYGDRLCHGDFHPFNVLGSLDAPVVVDWPDAHEGSPAADICRSYVMLRPHYPDIAETVIAGAAAAEGLDPAEILAWVPLVAAARLAENVPDEAPALLAMARDRQGWGNSPGAIGPSRV